MKESKTVTKLAIDTINATTGELVTLNSVVEETSKYYNVKSITSRINNMNLFTIMSKILKSSKDIATLGSLLEMSDHNNNISINNISRLSKELNIGRSKLSSILKDMCEVKPEPMFIKIDVGIYFVNPFIFIGKRVRSNANRERVQAEWTIKTKALSITSINK
jgi:hypothetical protein